MANVRIGALHKSYGSVHAVRGVDLDIPDGVIAQVGRPPLAEEEEE